MDKPPRFDEMITPRIITLVYWLALAGVVIAGLGSMFAGFGGISMQRIVVRIAGIAAGVLAARITCELLIVLFKIHENIHHIAKGGGVGQRAA